MTRIPPGVAEPAERCAAYALSMSSGLIALNPLGELLKGDGEGAIVGEETGDDEKRVSERMAMGGGETTYDPTMSSLESAYESYTE